MSTPSSDSTPERGPDEAFCRECGEIIKSAAEICPHCGVRQRPPPKSSFESVLDDLFEGGNPFVAAVLSVIFPGLGQLYNRDLERGLAFIVGGFVAGLSTIVLIGFVLYPIVWLASIYDAYVRAERYTRSDAPDDTQSDVSVDARSDALDDESTDDGRS